MKYLKPNFANSYFDESDFRLYCMYAVALLAFMLLPDIANAATAPWETFAQTLACTMRGGWVKWMAVLAIAIGGLMFGLGEMNGPFQKILQIAGGFSIALGSVAVATTLLGSFNDAGQSNSLACTS
jgi:type IV secretory pathway VirB2 component (pilin)